MDGSSKLTFVDRLWEAVGNTASTSNQIIKWSADGDSVVLATVDQAAQLLKYTRNTFLGCLGQHGFKKLNYGQVADCKYAHPCFKRGRPDLLTHVVRKTAWQPVERKSFVTLLWEAVENDGSNQIIKWSADGDSVVLATVDQAAQLLKYVRKTFLACLGQHGFKKLNYGQVADCKYAHPCFKRGRPDLLTHVVRKTAWQPVEQPGLQAAGAQPVTHPPGQRTAPDRTLEWEVLLLLDSVDNISPDWRRLREQLKPLGCTQLQSALIWNTAHADAKTSTGLGLNTKHGLLCAYIHLARQMKHDRMGAAQGAVVSWCCSPAAKQADEKCAGRVLRHVMRWQCAAEGRGIIIDLPKSRSVLTSGPCYKLAGFHFQAGTAAGRGLLLVVRRHLHHTPERMVEAKVSASTPGFRKEATGIVLLSTAGNAVFTLVQDLREPRDNRLKSEMIGILQLWLQGRGAWPVPIMFKTVLRGVLLMLLKEDSSVASFFTSIPDGVLDGSADLLPYQYALLSSARATRTAVPAGAQLAALMQQQLLAGSTVPGLGGRAPLTGLGAPTAMQQMLTAAGQVTGQYAVPAGAQLAALMQQQLLAGSTVPGLGGRAPLTGLGAPTAMQQMLTAAGQVTGQYAVPAGAQLAALMQQQLLAGSTVPGLGGRAPLTGLGAPTAMQQMLTAAGQVTGQYAVPAGAQLAALMQQQLLAGSTVPGLGGRAPLTGLGAPTAMQQMLTAAGQVTGQQAQLGASAHPLLGNGAPAGGAGAVNTMPIPPPKRPRLE